MLKMEESVYREGGEDEMERFCVQNMGFHCQYMMVAPCYGWDGGEAWAGQRRGNVGYGEEDDLAVKVNAINYTC